jgi:hypothetical protein
MNTDTVVLVGGIAIGVIWLTNKMKQQRPSDFPQVPGESWIPPDQPTGPSTGIPTQPGWLCDLLKIPGCGTWEGINYSGGGGGGGRQTMM